ncbi:MAG: Mrp/NBP35 family ATP-binding protein [SAR202 cluster bacterium]|nr:Mrp/NBP35 family ATP-binding protein [SAR202 cluster bacterium]
MTQPQPANPQAAQARARIQQMKRSFEEKRAITDSLAGVKRTIGVYSGKGGVGKTTVAVNLAVTLAQEGAKVGILDVDIDCPNVVRAMKVSEAPTVNEDKKMYPPERFGVRIMSMGFFQKDEKEAIIWRGPMVHNAINQLLQSTDWGELDYLIVDLPPGTSDSPLTVMQTLTLDGFVVVTTPQELSKVDALRSINMIKTLKVNVLGIVENFSGEMFGSGAGEELASELDLPFLGRLELRPDYRDTSRPTVLTSKTVLAEYQQIVEQAKAVLETLAPAEPEPAEGQ